MRMRGKNYVIVAIIGVVIIFAFVGFVVLKNSQTESSINNSSNEAETVATKADKVEIFLFHATQRCPTCIAIGRLAGETINERFQEELKSGLVEFREVNIDLPENKALAQKFQAVGSALYINAIKDGADNIQQDVRVWSLVGNTAQFKDYLENKINNLLGG